ncbi:MAG TPA: 6-phosphogluconolactonase [Alphaproteobacteria bacterium]|nr:6-phosphogluconolactonase [Alphaproteobacteria bacterium]
MQPLRRDFATQDELVGALARQVGDIVAEAVAQRGRAALVLSGGRTPEALFRRLAPEALPWAQVTATLADERWVPESSPDSNAALVRRTLMTGPAAALTFLPLYNGAATPEEGAPALSAELRATLPLPLDLVLLGMGEDGHTASFFPGGDRLAEALAGEGPACPLRAPGAPQPRITLTLPLLLNARRIVLLITGESKRRVLEAALGEGPVEDMPVRAVLRQDRVPVDIHWAP